MERRASARHARPPSRELHPQPAGACAVGMYAGHRSGASRKDGSQPYPAKRNLHAHGDGNAHRWFDPGARGMDTVHVDELQREVELVAGIGTAH